jgi:hypothetical protein
MYCRICIVFSLTIAQITELFPVHQRGLMNGIYLTFQLGGVSIISIHSSCVLY